MPTLTELPPWTIRTSGGEVTFTHAVARDGVAPGSDLALHPHDVRGFAKALGEVMKLPAYWRARARSARPEPVWSAPRHNADDGYVHVTGPCRPAERKPGARPAGSFTLDLVDVRELRVRIAAYLQQVS
ncbi:hypothetical protein GCM10027258_68830 [Amycolatopsis stemonae]